MGFVSLRHLLVTDVDIIEFSPMDSAFGCGWLLFRLTFCGCKLQPVILVPFHFPIKAIHYPQETKNREEREGERDLQYAYYYCRFLSALH